MIKDALDNRIAQFKAGYAAEEEFFTGFRKYFPSRSAVIELLDDFKFLMFPGYFDNESRAGECSDYLLGERLTHIHRILDAQVYKALMFRDGETLSQQQADQQARAICKEFMEKLPGVQLMLLKDIQALYDGDPAADCKEEILLCYPGFYAIFVHRLAHELFLLDVPLIPRLMSEYAHSITGIDIGPGATIGEYFFIDHGTGVVIGETTVIGDHVKLYQGVTLGATSTRRGQELSGVKRHPTIEDNVTIYSNASVLGGETVIGEGSVIGGSVFVCESVPKHSRVSLKNQEVSIQVRGEASKPIW
ncbi:MAG: serine O-acetyltransferase EpsC [Coriobacteriia bacterium]|nr:serine O-acetyltransferase EpsC [Coriobacteriia bacterium]